MALIPSNTSQPTKAAAMMPITRAALPRIFRMNMSAETCL